MNLDFLKEVHTATGKQRAGKNNKHEAEDEDGDSDTDYENDDTPFAASRNIQTVKVNEPRKPLAQTLQEIETSRATTSREAKNPTENG